MARLIRTAVGKELRFGIKQECQAELHADWLLIVDKLIEAARG